MRTDRKKNNVWMAQLVLKHKYSFGKSENLSKTFFAEMLVFDHDYEGKSLSSKGLLWISIYFITNLFEQIYTCYQLYFTRGT